MTTRPQLRTRKSQVVGVLAVALFGVMAVTFLTADFGTAEGFGGATGITAAIGHAMFNLAPAEATVPSEGFLIPFEIIDVVLVAALAAAVMLARREEDRESFLPLTDGGRPGGDGNGDGRPVREESTAGTDTAVDSDPRPGTGTEGGER